MGCMWTQLINLTKHVSTKGKDTFHTVGAELIAKLLQELLTPMQSYSLSHPLLRGQLMTHIVRVIGNYPIIDVLAAYQAAQQSGQGQ